MQRGLAGPTPTLRAPALFGERDHRWGPLPEGLSYQGAQDLGERGEAGVPYELHWVTRGPNRDRPYEGDPPPPQMLRVVRVDRDAVTAMSGTP